MNNFQKSERFTIQAVLDSGENWKKYKVHDRSTDREVALEVISPVDTSVTRRIVKEFRVLAEISHPNIASVYDFECLDTTCLITSELVEGVTFLEYVRPVVLGKPSTFDETRLRSAWAQLAAALTTIHEKGVVHRDLKPTNVLVTKDARLVVLDFGSTQHVRDLEIVGTPDYMAPEIGAQLPATPASDWYSAGVMLYQVLTGRLPFAGTFAEVLMSKQTSDPVQPNELAANVPPDLNDLCIRLLERNPSQRPTAVEILVLLATKGAPQRPKDLEQMISELPIEAQGKVRQFVESLLGEQRKSHKKKLQQNWAGGLRAYREKYTALELQKRALGWRGD